MRFFNLIRKKLLSQSKFTNYLLYAFGEIVLVVIGILIALQINNWNEQKKSERFELQMLGEIYKSLRYDVFINKQILNDRILVVDSNINSIFHMLATNSFDSAQFLACATNIQMGHLFSFSDGPYETLKIAGFDKVKNDTIRDKLIYFYDYSIPRREQFFSEYNSSSDFKEQRIMEKQIYEYKLKQSNEAYGFVIDGFKLKDYQDPVFMKYLDMRNESIKNGKSLFNSYLRESEMLIDLLLKEFKHREYPTPEIIILT